MDHPRIGDIYRHITRGTRLEIRAFTPSGKVVAISHGFPYSIYHPVIVAVEELQQNYVLANPYDREHEVSIGH